MWRARSIGDAFRIVTLFYYYFTSRHYNFFYNVRSSLPCWFFILVGPLIAGFLVAALTLYSDVASQSGSSDRNFVLFWAASVFILLLTLRLWSVPLISSFDLPLFLFCPVFITYRPEIGCWRPCRRVTFRLQLNVGYCCFGIQQFGLCSL
jgi:hypothetical protein